MENGKPTLEYADPRGPRPTPGWVVALVGVALSWGPIGIPTAVVVGGLLGEFARDEGPPGNPHPNSGTPAFMFALMTWPILGIVGSVVAVLLGLRADRVSAALDAWHASRRIRSSGEGPSAGPS